MGRHVGRSGSSKSVSVFGGGGCVFLIFALVVAGAVLLTLGFVASKMGL